MILICSVFEVTARRAMCSGGRVRLAEIHLVWAGPQAMGATPGIVGSPVAVHGNRTRAVIEETRAQPTLCVRYKNYQENAVCPRGHLGIAFIIGKFSG